MPAKRRLAQWLLIVVLLSACATPAGPTSKAPAVASLPGATSRPGATNALRPSTTSRPTTTLRATWTPVPTSTLRPTNTPRPTIAPRATNTPRATSTPRATGTPGATRVPAGTPPPTISAAQLPRVDASMVAALTHRLTASTSVADAVLATREALALGGLGTWDGERFLVQAAAPAAAGFVIPEETVVLAMEARQRPTTGHLTLAQLGEMLKDLGWPFPKGRIPGELLREVFRGWVSDGLAQPEASLSFTPLFLREMALTQQPPIDLAKGDYDPEHLHLTLLELELFAAHFDRIGRAAAGTSWDRVPGLAVPAVQAAAPCSEAYKWLESLADDAGQAALAAARIDVNVNIVGPALRQALRDAGLSQGAAQQIGRGLSALSIASKLFKLVALYSHAQVAVTVEGANPIHAPSASEGRKTDTFRARAGVSDEDWDEYQQAYTSSDVVRGLRDCFSFYGLPVLPDLGDIAKEAKDWKVEWRLNGAPEWVRINEADNAFVHPGILRMKLAADGDHSTSAPLVVEILPEKGQTHSGPEKRAIAVASATVHTAKPPSMMTWINAIRGGLGNALALGNAVTELCAGWIVEALPPKAYASLTVTYHEGGGEAWSGRINYEKTRTVDETKSGIDPWGKYSSMSHAFESFSEIATVDVGRNELRSDTGPEKRWDLSGSALVVYQNELLYEYSKEDRDCKDGVATRHERNYSMYMAVGTGRATGYLTTPRSDGTYSLSINIPFELLGQFERQSDTWWDNKPCVQDESHTQDTTPWSAAGPTISATGRLDPENPGVLSGQYEVTEVGYTITVTWMLWQES